MIAQQENLAKGALINLVGKLIGRAIHIGTQIILARWLGLALFGLYAIGWNLLRVGTSILPMGLDIAILKIGPRWWPNELKKVSFMLQIVGVGILIISLVTGFSLFSTSDWLGSLYSKPDLSLVMRLLALALPLALLLRVAAYATRITQNMQYGIISEEIIQPVSNLGIAVLLLFLGGGLSGAIWAINISFGLALAYAIFILVKMFPSVWVTRIRFDNEVLAKVWSTSAPLAVAAIFSTLILLVDRLMVGFFLSEVEAGLYQAASIFAIFFVTVLSAFKTIVAPLVAAAFDRGDTQAVEESFKLSTRWGIYFSIPVGAVLIMAPGATLEVLFGTPYISASFTLVALTFGQLANVLSGPVEYYLIMSGSTKTWVLINASMLILNISLNLILIPSMGILGAGISTAITFTLTSVISLLAVRYKTKIFPYDFHYIRGLLAALGMVLGLMGIRMFGIQPQWLQLAALALIAPTAFFLLVWKLGIDPEEQRLLIAIFNQSNK